MFKGRTKSPEDCLAPIVIINTAAALIIIGQVEILVEAEIEKFLCLMGMLTRYP